MVSCHQVRRHCSFGMVTVTVSVPGYRVLPKEFRICAYVLPEQTWSYVRWWVKISKIVIPLEYTINSGWLYSKNSYRIIHCVNTSRIISGKTIVAWGKLSLRFVSPQHRLCFIGSYAFRRFLRACAFLFFHSWRLILFWSGPFGYYSYFTSLKGKIGKKLCAFNSYSLSYLYKICFGHVIIKCNICNMKWKIFLQKKMKIEPTKWKKIFGFQERETMCI